MNNIDFYQFDDKSIVNEQFQFTPDEIGPIHCPNSEMQNPFPSTLLEALKCYYSNQRTNLPLTTANMAPVEGLSTQEIIKIAVDAELKLDNPFNLRFRGEDTEKIKLIQLLLASANKVFTQQHSQARTLLDQCEVFSSSTGTAIQRVVHYFAKALRERIDVKMGRINLLEPGKLRFSNFDEDIMASISTVVACHSKVPFSQVAYFAGIQTIIENVSHKRGIHIIDLGIRTGVQWTVLMQALVSQSTSPLELLKITAISTNQTWLVEQTGKRLEKFARSMNIPFQFKLITLTDTLDFNEEMSKLGNDEEVVVHTGFLLCGLLSFPDKLNSVMEVVRKLNPKIMVVIHPEIDSSGSFVDRFVEALGYFGALFDCIEACMGDDNPNRVITEYYYVGDVIKTIVATGGEETRSQSTKLGFWRPLFVRFGMEEMEISAVSLNHANLIVEKNEKWNSCNLEIDGKSLIIGWKGTPMRSLSAWRFY